MIRPLSPATVYLLTSHAPPNSLVVSSHRTPYDLALRAGVPGLVAAVSKRAASEPSLPGPLAGLNSDSQIVCRELLREYHFVAVEQLR